MMVLTCGVWLLLGLRRIPFIVRARLTPAELATPGLLAQRSPAAVTVVSDNFKNLFEVPVLFYALGLLLYATQQVDRGYVAAAWIFVAFRVAHSLVHCTINKVTLRFALYLMSTLAVWFMLGRLLLRYALH